MKSEKVKIKILPLWVTEQKSKFTKSGRNELAAGTACPLKSAQTRLHSVTEQKSEFIEGARNELAAGTACPLKSAQTRLHSVTEQKSKFTKIGRNELAAGTARRRFVTFSSRREENQGVAAVQPAASSSPPDCCFQMVRISYDSCKKTATPIGVAVFLVTRRRFELRTHCLKGSCSTD